MEGPPTAALLAPKPKAPKPASVHVYPAFVEAAIRTGEMSGGFHNRNFVTPLTEPMARLVGRPCGTQVTVRLRNKDALPVVVRTWKDESQILDALRGVLPGVPRCLAKSSHSAVVSYVEGVPLSSICQNGKPVDPLLIEALVGQLADMARVGRGKLPELPPDWPRDGQSRTFLRHLAMLTDRDVRQANWTEFGGLFAALGIPQDAISAFADRVPSMVRRPFSLLHADLHRDNVIVSYETAPPLVFVDWELASFGDPLHDLAVHLVRMKYPQSQLEEVKGAWLRAMRRTRPEAANGLDTDLPHYLAYEYAQSVYPDVMRAAQSLGSEREPVGLREAAEAVSEALAVARGPLRLGEVPDIAEIAQILSRWHAARAGRDGKGAYRPLDVIWVSPGGFSEEEVAQALAAEGAAPSHCVFKGTGHLNTVVHVRGEAVVVRRKLRAATRREQCYNDETAVLTALAGQSGIRAPRVLALGESVRSDAFAVHSYEGPYGEPPVHPVDGLTPYEADSLVDQLVTLADVPVDGLEPGLAPGGFYRWLSDRLVDLVASLPQESLRLALELGLPDAAQLKTILHHRTVTPRVPVLLHGDLNPWNLVRVGRFGQLAIIDWEMAVVGDPLYDLMRHLHLAPHSREIRQRMLDRWTKGLGGRGSGYVEGWARDMHTYRWIELVRSAYVDLDRLVTGASLDAPNVRRAVDSYAMTLRAATASLGLRHPRVMNPYLALALPLGRP
ncbi:aminoglycoside phosphotransferase family protein [Streptomyces sp. NPDC048442]|uniref:aminoglycoside phosphotransferase family protein n=1 Tax=Streptomyces sp. NPDC048442 TaxID=3154823 RepID=UPI00341F6DA2